MRCCGYGRTLTGRAGLGVGVNVNPWMTTDADGLVSIMRVELLLLERKAKKIISLVFKPPHMGVTGKKQRIQEVINADEAETVYMTYGLVRQGFQGISQQKPYPQELLTMLKTCNRSSG